ncbi:Cell envelope-associated transcriptional attenuator LytR-CpsA-Psr, subfamily A1 (as in PMID19099556) [Alloactinosynnema sp. L-07]|uniref:LCP family protein n=1 Tax=Alloactinosynnema sp. L-07 TaxID=1653480 RepID=UPI00065F01ED|nr:LCP family protein [Alloactinosynnema sp. L-07]CRK57540.1 Cell envelope-associated transcriptional attenuator LytR-CpsA-Psr, subfamily A1 (as in PMID19099556) [Alloactinosynnema sp. L-07]
MTFDKTESLIRDAITDQAARAVDPEAVLRELRRGSGARRGSRQAVLVFAAAAVVIAVVSAVVVPGLVRSDRPPAGTPDIAAAMADQTILVLGRDEFGYTDVVMLTRLTATGLTAISIPRDVFVDIPGHGPGRVNIAYARGRWAAEQRGQDAAASTKAGVETAMATVRSLAGVPIDHYAVIDMAAVPTMVDAVGGVEVCLRAATSDRYSGADFNAGRQTLSGAQALAFVRQRRSLPNGDLDRVKRQQAFFTALTAKVVAKGDLSAMVGVVRDHVVTDLDLVDLAQRASERTVRMGVIPVDGQIETPAVSALGVTGDKVRSYVGGMFNGPDQTGGGGTQDPPCVD